MRMKNNIVLVAALGSVLCGCARNDVAIDGDDLSQEALAAARACGYQPPLLGRDTLRIYTWEEFFAPHVIASFEKALGVKVVIDIFESNEDMLEKLKTEGGDYDIITPSSYIIPSMAKAELVAKLNHLRLPNVRKNFDRRITHVLIDPKLTYNIPYTINYTGIHYDRSQIPTGADPESFSIFGNPQLRGRTAIFNDMRETIGAALLSLGYSINSTNPAEIDAATELVIKWKRLAARSDDSFYADGVNSGKLTATMCYSYMGFQSIIEANSASNGAAIAQEFKLPSKGGYSLSVDEFVIGAHSTHKPLAYAFINYMYDANVARSSMEAMYAAMPVRPAYDRLNPELWKLLTLSAEQFQRGQVIMGFSDRPKVGKLYDDAWTRIQAVK